MIYIKQPIYETLLQLAKQDEHHYVSYRQPSDLDNVTVESVN